MGTSSCSASKPLLSLLAFLTVLLLVLITLRDQLSPWTIGFRGVGVTVGGSTEPTAAAATPKDRLLGGLLSPDFDEQSCLSRYQITLYRKTSTHILSSYLLSKLRKYEALHKKCGPNTPLFQKSVEQIKLNHSTDQLECNYVVLSPFDGIGNRMLSITATFLYALLTDRVMLIHLPEDMDDLLCEPFPGTTWYLPSDFPIQGLEWFNTHSQNSYGYLVEKNLINTDPKAPPSSLPSSIYVHLMNDMREAHLHVRFFCDDDQLIISKINWVLLRTNQYIIPGLFIIPKYAEELERMFPSKETVFHHLGRYLLHPSNTVWGMIMRYHDSYLTKSKETIGIQIRNYSHWAPISAENAYEQVVRCTQQELILPSVNLNQSHTSPLTSTKATSKTVLLVSLSRDVYERLYNLYYEHPTITGELISVYQPSHEEQQKFFNKFHNYKAMAEIWLLSFSDVLVTTAVSTFGYVSYSLAGIKPWYLWTAILDRNITNHPCRRALSLDPCYHTPPHFNCKTGGKADPRNIVPYVRQCDDYTHDPAIKLYD
ncbi:fucosyltransferase 2 [Rhynchospora pubera]|uniref:Fucosyltransferase n=1 Tax=Rhynchospora pubera TaxID=906938 RepID=A0AAV8F432_9POAL|nr:fucosyltransferase 2 [Rhynchospora pubera]